MKLIKCFLEKNDCYKANKYITVKGLLLHSTGSNNPYIKRYVQPDIEGIGKNKYNNDWNRSGIKKCVHGFIGKLDNGEIATVQTLPWDMRGWHSGGAANNTHIGIEICENDLTNKEYFDKVYKEAVEVFAFLCKKFDLNPLVDIIDHNEGYKKNLASNHADVMHWFKKHNKSMTTFRNDVNKLVKKNTVFEPYLVQVNTAVLNVRAEAGTHSKIVTQVRKGEVFTIVEEFMNGKTKWGKLKSGAGWISLQFTKRFYK